MLDLLGHLAQSLESGLQVALCQVVSTRGSTPQKAGALMLLFPDGHQIGTLGGGCVEAEVKRKAAGLIGRPGSGAVIHRFVLDHDPEWADGLICGGRMVILADCPTGRVVLAYYQRYLELLRAGLGFTEAIALEPSSSGARAAGDRFLFDHDGQLVGTTVEEGRAAEILVKPSPLSDQPRPTEVGSIAYLPTRPRIRW